MASSAASRRGSVPGQGKGRAKEPEPLPPREGYLREVRFQILKAYKEVYPKLLERHPGPMYLPVSFDALVSSVVARIGGMLRTSPKRIRLVFCGQVLDPKGYLPEEAFEALERPSEDDDLFRPRLFVALKHIHEDDPDPETDDEEEEEQKEEGGLSKLASSWSQKLATSLKEVKAEDEAKVEDPDAGLDDGFDLDPEDDPLAAVLPADDEDPLLGTGPARSQFDLRKELTLIECEKYFDVINNNGYSELVSASSHFHSICLIHYSYVTSIYFSYVKYIGFLCQFRRI